MAPQDTTTYASPLLTDASELAASAILEQPDDAGALHPVAFESRKPAPPERSYPPPLLELLSVVHMLRVRCGPTYSTVTVGTEPRAPAARRRPALQASGQVRLSQPAGVQVPPLPRPPEPGRDQWQSHWWCPARTQACSPRPGSRQPGGLSQAE